MKTIKHYRIYSVIKVGDLVACCFSCVWCSNLFIVWGNDEFKVRSIILKKILEEYQQHLTSDNICQI